MNATQNFEITRQALDAGTIVHTGWELDGVDTRSIDGERAEQTSGVNVIDYFDLSGNYLGTDENGLAPTFGLAECSYEVVTDAENTGLDGEVFATREEADSAVGASVAIFDQSKFEIIKTKKQATTTFAEWNRKGW